jgi:hypothetical protein
MKAKLWVVFFITIAALGSLLFVQRCEIRRQKQFIEMLQLQIESNSGTERAAKNQLETVKKENQTIREKLSSANVELNKTRLALKSAMETSKAQSVPPMTAAFPEKGNKTSNPMSALADMLKDPEMKKAMAQQQRGMLDTMYGGLFKELQLTPENTDKLKDLLLDQQMSAMSDGMNVFDQMNSTNRVEIGKKIAEAHKQKEDQIKALLGDEKFQQYKDYTSSMSERMILDQFAKQSELRPEQTEQLLALMKEEKQNAQINQPVAAGFDPADPSNDWQKIIGSNELMEKQLAQQEQINNNVLERAHQILTPEQFTKFEAQLKNQLTMQQLGIKMARKMMNPEAAETQPAQK